ncbi:MAG TPA: maleylpyruvate isomerase N-terminal domain-containing protein, partial [Mycobacteriales bacterium]|nr:maleylpyruvate isomerase N-terminal domain-containing protein [Mycobacteriales bacterium]
MMAGNSHDRFIDAVDGFTARVANVATDDLARATPCTDWNVADLVNHVINEMLWMPPLLDGKTIADVGDR